MTRQTYTKAAHFACLRDMLPSGRLTIVGEQESTSARVLPHLFQDDVEAGRFEWHVVSFHKDPSKPLMLRKTREFEKQIEAFRKAHPDLSRRESLILFTEKMLQAATTFDGHRHSPFPISNFRGRAFPSLWLRSPVQMAGEIDKVVGFPILRPGLREEYKRFRFDELMPEGDLASAISRRAVDATLHPVSTFMNAARERLSFTKRSGGRATRNAGGYVNGALYNPRVLIAVMNIYRVWYNYFEERPYEVTTERDEDGRPSKPAKKGVRRIRRPGSDTVLEVPSAPRIAPVTMTPAMRLGIHSRDKKVPDPARILYQPWIHHGTPLWKKLAS